MSLSKKQNRLQTQKANLQLPKQKGTRAGVSLGLAVHTAVYKINIKDLLYILGNYIQYVVITYNGK